MIYENEIHPAQVPCYNVTTDGAEVSIGKADFPYPFHIGLEYAPPARGHWTIAHSPMLIPGLHEIYVCCACCLHGVVLSADEVPEGAGRFSMVTVTNENVIKGNLEDMMIEGISQILDDLPQKPRCVEAFTSCIQHFLHIDLHVVYDTLRRRYPDIDFIDGYMTPTLNRRYVPDVLGRRQLLRAVQPLPKKRAVNYIVNYYPVESACELTAMLRNAGYEVHDFAAAETYEDYKQLGEATANIYFLDNSRLAAKDMERRLGQQPLFAPYAYTYDGIRHSLQVVADALVTEMPDCGAYEASIEAKAAEALKEIGTTPIAIDATATPRPFSLARFLLTHGFHVYAIYIDFPAQAEEEDFRFLQQHYPELSLRSVSHWKRRLLPRNDSRRYGKVLAIGQMAAYFADTNYFVNLIENSGLWGYTGLLTLLDYMAAANRTENKRMREIIQVKAWGCHG